MTGSTSQTTPQSPAAEKKSKEPRLPRPGDQVLFTDYVQASADARKELVAFVAHSVGQKATLAVLNRSGQWVPQHMVPFDASGETPGSWRWEK